MLINHNALIWTLQRSDSGTNAVIIYQDWVAIGTANPGQEPSWVREWYASDLVAQGHALAFTEFAESTGATLLVPPMKVYLRSKEHRLAVSQHGQDKPLNALVAKLQRTIPVPK